MRNMPFTTNMSITCYSCDKESSRNQLTKEKEGGAEMRDASRAEMRGGEEGEMRG